MSRPPEPTRLQRVERFEVAGKRRPWRHTAADRLSRHRRRTACGARRRTLVTDEVPLRALAQPAQSPVAGPHPLDRPDRPAAPRRTRRRLRAPRSRSRRRANRLAAMLLGRCVLRLRGPKCWRNVGCCSAGSSLVSPVRAAQCSIPRAGSTSLLRTLATAESYGQQISGFFQARQFRFRGSAAKRRRAVGTAVTIRRMSDTSDTSASAAPRRVVVASTHRSIGVR